MARARTRVQVKAGNACDASDDSEDSFQAEAVKLHRADAVKTQQGRWHRCPRIRPMNWSISRGIQNDRAERASENGLDGLIYLLSVAFLQDGRQHRNLDPGCILASNEPGFDVAEFCS